MWPLRYLGSQNYAHQFLVKRDQAGGLYSMLVVLCMTDGSFLLQRPQLTSTVSCSCSPFHWLTWQNCPSLPSLHPRNTQDKFSSPPQGYDTAKQAITCTSSSTFVAFDTARAYSKIRFYRTITSGKITGILILRIPGGFPRRRIDSSVG